MKVLLIAFSILTFSQVSSAQVAQALTAGTVAGAATAGVGFLSMSLDRSCAWPNSGGTLCDWGSSSYTSSPLSALIISTLVGLNKEEVQMIKDDSILFLAGFEKTLSLEEFLEDIKSQNEELEEVTDEEIISTLLTILN